VAENDEIIVGDMKIAESVLTKMVRESAAETMGVAQVRDVAVASGDEGITVEIGLTVGHSTVYPEVAAQVQKAVAQSIGQTTGVKVSEVNITVDRLDFAKE
jgi:uncharacterized alkaline shock family protein YloU